MKCQYCDGTGEHINDANRMTTCEFCDGTGVIKSLTNEEWIHTLNTEQLAEFLLKIGEIDEAPIPCGDLMECSKNCGLYSQCAGDDVMPTNKEIWLEWLKQPHSEVGK